MASRLARHAFLRSSRATFNGSRGQLVKRFQSTSHGSGSSQKSSDTPWIIGSLIAFGPAFIYLVSPASRKTAPHVPKSHANDKPAQAVKVDEGADTETAKSTQKAETPDVPKADAAETPAEPANAEPVDTIADDEGTKVPVKEVEESVKQSVATDSPKVAGEKDEQPSSEPEPVEENTLSVEQEDKNTSTVPDQGKPVEKGERASTTSEEANNPHTNLPKAAPVETKND